MSCSLHESTDLPDPKVVQVGEGMFAYIQPDGSWWVNHTAYLVGRRGVVSIDSCATERRTRAYLDAIRAVAGARCARWSTPTTTATTPTATTCSPRRRSWPRSGAGGRSCAPACPTPTGCGPGPIGAPSSSCWEGSLSGAVDAAAGLRRYGARTIVPGQGGECGPEVIDEVLGCLQFIGDVARRGKEAGLSPLDAARESDLGPYGEWLDRERIVGNLHRVNAELAGAPPGAPIDAAAVLHDMVACNRGKSLRWLA